MCFKVKGIKENSKVPFITDFSVFKVFKVVKKRQEYTRYNSIMNEWNWFAVLKTWEKMNLILVDAIDLNISVFAVF